MFKYLFLLLLLIFVSIKRVNAKNETFTLAANEVVTFILPVFSSNSTIENFNDTLSFLLALPNLPKSFYIYAFGDIHQCLSNIPYTCDIEDSDTKNYSSLDDDDFLEKLYENSVIETQHSCYVYLKLAYLLALKITPLCDNSTNCYVQRINFIALTDYDKIESFYNFTQTSLEQSFYFVFTTAPKPDGNDTSITVGYYYVNDDIPDSSIADDIFSDEIYYTFDPSKNFYNVFIVSNASSLHDMTAYAAYILEDSYAMIDSFWGFLSPLFYVLSVKLENGSYYQTVNVFLNGMNSTKFITTLQTVVYGTLTPTLDTSIAQTYFKKIYNNSDQQQQKHQWNIVITDEFPHWLKNTSIIFDSFYQHLDIYLMSLNNSVIANELESSLKTSMNEILVADKNASKRANHILLLPFDTKESIYQSVKQMPSVKIYMGATIFSYQQKSQWWIWVIIGSILFLIVIATTLIILLWKYRKWKQIMQKYSWAVDSGISIKEANTFVEAGKELFIEGSFITVDFNTIIGKGSSAIVYEGLLSTVSPVSVMYPRLETRNYSDCKTAIKIGNTFSKDEFEQIFREVEAAIKIGWHRHIYCLLGWSVYQSMPILLFELIEGQDLLTWAQSYQDSSESEESAEIMPEKTVTQILWQISDGMEYIASLGILHRDLAARNILLSQRLEAKITDFGLASSCHEASFTYEAPVQRKLPIRWMAPEALKNRTFSEFSDVWSFATLAWEVFSKGEIPYGSMDGNDILEYVSAGNRLKIPEEVSDEWKKLLNVCWSEEKDQRPSFKEIRCKIGAFLETQTLNYGYLITTGECNNKNL